jgi:hypothetical protein
MQFDGRGVGRRLGWFRVVWREEVWLVQWLMRDSLKSRDDFCEAFRPNPRQTTDIANGHSVQVTERLKAARDQPITRESA